ncbi:DnaJ domain-containing protein [Pleurocapsales cyanobacterium LEGE 10410]|nr:DnaJ domain-containing protein [Pleurocapsales cyanobacterium LEGE 10410]
MKNILQCYAILGIKHTATPEATRKAYRNMAKVWHPDRYVNNPTLKAKAEIEIKKINQAYEAIKVYLANKVEAKVEQDLSSPQRAKFSRKQNSPESYYQQGVTYAEQENYEAALNSFAQAIKLNADYLEAYQYRGFILSKLGYKLRADAEFKKAHQIRVKNTKKSYERQYTPQAYNAPHYTASATVKTQTSRPLQYQHTILADRQSVERIAISKNQTFASVSNEEIKLWQLNSGQRIGTLQGHTDRVTCLIMSPSGQTLISGSKDKTIKFWDLREKKIIRTLGGYFNGHLSKVVALAISPDNRTLLSCGTDNSLKIWDVHQAREIQNISFSAAITCLAFSPNGQLFCSGGLEPQIRVRAKNGQVIRSLNNKSGILSLAFSPDGRLLATGGFNRQINIWDLATGKVIQTLEGHSDRVSSVIFSNDGQTLISSSWDQTIKLWELTTGEEVASIEAHAAKINTMAIASDNRTLITGSSDRTIKLWQCNYLANKNLYQTVG